jgi:hypothetical protein
MTRSLFVVGQRVVCLDGFDEPFIPVGTTGQITQLNREEAWVKFPAGRVRVPFFSLKPALLRGER